MILPSHHAGAQGDQVARHGAVEVSSGDSRIHHGIEGLGPLVLSLGGDIRRLVKGMEMVKDRLELIFGHPRRQEHRLKIPMRHQKSSRSLFAFGMISNIAEQARSGQFGSKQAKEPRKRAYNCTVRAGHSASKRRLIAALQRRGDNGFTRHVMPTGLAVKGMATYGMFHTLGCNMPDCSRFVFRVKQMRWCGILERWPLDKRA